MNKFYISVLSVFLFLLLSRLPFFLTHHIQEDAYIFFRTAFNWADNGILSFNTYENVTGVTSVLTLLFLGAIRILLGEHAIIGWQVVGTIMLISACFLFTKTIFKERFFGPWIALSLVPVSLWSSYLGMETPMLILAICASFHAIVTQRLFILLISLAAIPLIRLDASIYGLFIGLAAIASRAHQDKNILPAHTIYIVSSISCGVFLCISWNLFIDGSPLPHTAMAKKISYDPDYSINSIATRIISVFSTATFTPLQINLMNPFGAFFSLLFITSITVFPFLQPNKEARISLVLLGVSALFMTLIFSSLGAYHPWYFWPASFIFYAYIVCIIFIIISKCNPVFGIVFKIGAYLSLFLLFSAQLLVSLNNGFQLFYVTAEVGRYINSHSKINDTVFLEPAGYIPFYSQRETVDTVGLISRKIIDYKIRHPQDWWFRYVRECKPEFIVERENFYSNWITYEGYKLNPDEIRWFKVNYPDPIFFGWNPHKHFSNQWLIQILSKSGNLSYYLYQRPQGAPDNSIYNNVNC